jgi:hypothetical protein
VVIALSVERLLLLLPPHHRLHLQEVCLVVTILLELRLRHLLLLPIPLVQCRVLMVLIRDTVHRRLHPCPCTDPAIHPVLLLPTDGPWILLPPEVTLRNNHRMDNSLRQHQVPMERLQQGMGNHHRTDNRHPMDNRHRHTTRPTRSGENETFSR